jgi:hypothetical protein
VKKEALCRRDFCAIAAEDLMVERRARHEALLCRLQLAIERRNARSLEPEVVRDEAPLGLRKFGC